MKISVVLTDLSTNYVDSVDIIDPDNRKCFSYIDNQEFNCKMMVFDDGICLYRANNEYSLKLNLRKNGYALIKSVEGEIKLDTKVVDFIQNDDILVMHYLIDSVERKIEIIYRS